MNNLKQLRLNAGLTQPQLAKLCQQADRRIDVAMVSRFENGVCLPTPAVAKALASSLRCDISELYDVPEQMYLPGILAADAPVEPESMDVTNLIAYLTEAKEPVRRGELSVLMDRPDRIVRRIIEEARNDGYLIVNNGGGYFLATSLDDIRRHYNTENARAVSIFKRLRRCREILKQEGLL